MALVFITGMLLMTCICEGALIRKSSASDFLQTKRERRDAECYFGDCSSESSEVDEALNTGPDYEDSPDGLFEGHVEQSENEEDTSDMLYDGAEEHAENEETLDVSDPGTELHATEEMPTHVDTGDNSAQMNGPDEQKMQDDGLDSVDGSGM